MINEEEKKETCSITELHPLRDKSPLPLDSDKEILFLRYKEIVSTLVSNGFVSEEAEPYVLSTIREHLGLPVVGIFSVSKSLDIITLKSD